MKIAVLAENTSVSEKLESEHGLSLYIEFQNHKLLYDMGKSDLFLKNAAKMGVHPEDADCAFVSHGHNDHGGGLPYFLNVNGSAPVYVSPFYFEKHFNGQGKDLSVPKVDSSQIQFVRTPTEVLEGATVYPSLGEMAEEIRSGNMTAVHHGKPETDTFLHEQYLLLEEKGKRVLFSSCSHRGVYNIASYFRPDVFVGGFHFKDFSVDVEEDRMFLRSMAEKLSKLPTFYYTCHCTGLRQYEFLKTKMKNLEKLSTGKIVEI